MDIPPPTDKANNYRLVNLALVILQLCLFSVYNSKEAGIANADIYLFVAFIFPSVMYHLSPGVIHNGTFRIAAHVVCAGVIVIALMIVVQLAFETDAWRVRGLQIALAYFLTPAGLTSASLLFILSYGSKAQQGYPKYGQYVTIQGRDYVVVEHERRL